MNNLKKELKKALFYGVLKFNKKYRKNSFLWKLFDFFYFLLRFLLKIIFGKKNKDQIIAKLGIEKIITKSFVPEGVIYHRIEDRGIIEEIYDIKTYENIKIESNNPILDLGGHIGLFALKFARLNRGEVYTFEPSKESFNLLKKNVEINHIKNVQAINAAVSDKAGMLKLYLHKYSAANSILNKTNHWVNVKSIGLGDFIKQNKIKKIELIKIDVEGAEYKILKSSINVLKKTSKVILELHEDILSKEQLKEIERIFEKLKFRKKEMIKEPKMICYYKS